MKRRVVALACTAAASLLAVGFAAPTRRGEYERADAGAALALARRMTPQQLAQHLADVRAAMDLDIERVTRMQKLWQMQPAPPSRQAAATPPRKKQRTDFKPFFADLWTPQPASPAAQPDPATHTVPGPVSVPAQHQHQLPDMEDLGLGPDSDLELPPLSPDASGNIVSGDDGGLGSKSLQDFLDDAGAELDSLP